MKDNRDDWEHAAVALLINDEGHICAVSRGRGENDWNLPGGKGEEGETPKQTVIRETREETGLRIHDLLHVHTRYDENRPVYFFMAEWEGKIRPSGEGDVRWVPWGKILDPKNTFSQFNQRLYEKMQALDH